MFENRLIEQVHRMASVLIGHQHRGQQAGEDRLAQKANDQHPGGGDTQAGRKL